MNTIFKSRQVNLDRDPWVHTKSGTRFHSSAVDGLGNTDVAPRRIEYFTFAPRPEFEPTRDPEPWECQPCGYRGAAREQVAPAGDHDGHIVWSPRREQFDTPVNGILVALRSGFPTSDWFGMLHCIKSMWGAQFTVAEQVHAEEVIERLIAARNLARLSNPKEIS